VRAASDKTSSTDTVDLKLSEEEVKYLEEPYKPMGIIGHW
jgi:hypothetical protein